MTASPSIFGATTWIADGPGDAQDVRRLEDREGRVVDSGTARTENGVHAVSYRRCRNPCQRPVRFGESIESEREPRGGEKQRKGTPQCVAPVVADVEANDE